MVTRPVRTHAVPVAGAVAVAAVPVPVPGRGNVRGVRPQLSRSPKCTFGHGPAELEEKAGTVVRILEDVVERPDEVVDLLLPADEGREELDDVDVVRRHLGQYPMPVEEGHHHHLGEDGRSQTFERVEAPAQPFRCRRTELQSDHQSLSPDFVEHLVALDQRLQCRVEGLTREARPLDDVLVVERGQRGQPGHHGQLIAAEGSRVFESFFEGAVDRREDAIRRENGADRDVAPGEGLGDRDDVGLEIPVLVAEELAGPPETGLHLVHHQQRLVPPAEFLHLLPVLRRCHVHALALNGLDDEGRRHPRAAVRRGAAEMSPNGTGVQPGSSWPKPSRKSAPPFSDECSGVSP